ncbi:MAG: 3-methyl-2-oxobutanoate hydroxymethyltransferase, partial [Candidatus Cloacimonetes bacterium]|nr:3-methyl-2-oxobutanoate hydroxymethyltransferase [Candidatus Cloacimonadota bacterium]
DCDGQVLVNVDMLGLFEEFKPRFVRQFAHLAEDVRRAVGDYATAVRSGEFPGKDEV